MPPMKMRVASTGAQTISAAEAAAFVTSGMWLDYGTGLGQPDAFDRALGARIHELTNVKIRHCLTMRPRAIHQADSEGRHVHSVSLHFSGCDRKRRRRTSFPTRTGPPAMRKMAPAATADAPASKARDISS